MKHHDPTPNSIPLSRSYERGKFGRLFPWLPPCIKEDSDMEALLEIANLMIGEKKVSNMPAGYTYLGQFIAHDISFDATTISERMIDSEFLWNFRTPALDLDSIYSGGPASIPYLYKGSKESYEFVIDESKNGCPMIPRIGIGEHQAAIIADSRNDENAIISQLHAAFMKLHNSISKEIEEERGMRKFIEARKLTTWHYQWVVLHDYLPRIVGRKLVNKILKKGRKFYKWRNEQFIPLEFSAASFRFGHSQVLGAYRFNYEESGVSVFEEPPNSTCIDWRFFFFDNQECKGGIGNKNNLITPKIISKLKNHEFDVEGNEMHNQVKKFIDGIDMEGCSVTDKEQFSKEFNHFLLKKGWLVKATDLAMRNLIRGKILKLPSGQAVARAMNIDALEINTSGFPKQHINNTPLWYYILYEAQVKKEGKRLGPVGSRIVGEVIIGLLQGDKTSFLNQDPKWRPMKKNEEGRLVEIQEGETFTMVDLLKLAGVYSTVPL